MNCLSRRAAAAVLAVALLLSSTATAAPVQGTLGRKTDLVGQAIKHIRKFLKIATNDDILTPPKPAPAPPPPPAQ